MNHTCRVCGYAGLERAPRGRDGGGSYEICPCCGYQYGVDDDDRQITPEAWREEWVKGGMKWWSKGMKSPAGWDPQAQLAKVLRAPRRRGRGAE